MFMDWKIVRASESAIYVFRILIRPINRRLNYFFYLQHQNCEWSNLHMLMIHAERCQTSRQIVWPPQSALCSRVAVTCRLQPSFADDSVRYCMIRKWMRKQNRNLLILLFLQKAHFAKKLQKFQCDRNFAKFNLY